MSSPAQVAAPVAPAEGFLAAFDAWQPGERPARLSGLLDAVTLRGLQQAAAQGGPPWPGIEARARALLADPEPPLVKEQLPDGGALELAFAHAVWGDPAFRDAALALVERLLAADSWVWHRPLGVDLRSAMVCSSLAQVHDLLAAELPVDLGERIVAALCRHDLGRYPEIARTGSEWWSTSRLNWQAVIHAHLGLAALALRTCLPSWRQTLRLAVAGVLDFLDAQPPDGSYREGLQYWQFGIGEAAWFARALQRSTAGAVNLLQHPYFRATTEFARQMSTPDGCFDFADCYNFRAGDWLMALFAAEYQDPTLQVLVQPPELQSPRFRKLDVPARGMRFVLAFDRQLSPVDHIAAPRSRAFLDSGLVCMRSHWGDQATYVGLQVGAPLAPHGHLDTGSFIVGSRGQRLIPDAGFWPYAPGFFDMNGRRSCFDGASMAGHSVVEVDGGGLRHGGPGGRLHAVCLEAAIADTVVCDLTTAYGELLERYFRYLLFLRPDTVLVFDDLQAAVPRSFQWNLQIAGQVDLQAQGAEISNGEGRATVLFAGLDRDDGYRLTSETRMSWYRPFVDDGERPPSIRRLHVTPLSRRLRWRFGALIQLGDRRCPPAATLACRDDDGLITLTCGSPAGRTVVQLDLANHTIRLVAVPDEEATA